MKSNGFGPGFRPQQLVYNEPSSTLVIAVERMSVDNFERRLFSRRSVERTYSPIGKPPSSVHYSEVVTSLKLPIVYYKATRVAKIDAIGEFASDWLSIERFDLRRNTAKTVIKKNDLLLPEPYNLGWVSQLHGVSSDDTTVFCTCGLQRPKEGKVHHWFCSIQVKTSKVSLISRLEGIWF
jgi:hypothetical protein